MFLVGQHVLEFLAAAQQVAVAAAFGHLQDVVRFQAIDDEEAIEVRAEYLFGHGVAAGAWAGANGVDGIPSLFENRLLLIRSLYAHTFQASSINDVLGEARDEPSLADTQPFQVHPHFPPYAAS